VNWINGAPASGNVLIAAAICNFAETPAVPSGWTALQTNAGSGSNPGSLLCYKLTDGTEGASVTWAVVSGNAKNLAVAMLNISAASLTTPQSSMNIGTSSASVTTASITPAVVNSLVVAFFVSMQATTGVSTASGWSAQATAGTTYSAFAEIQDTYAPNTTTGITVSATLTASTVTGSAAFQAIIAPKIGSYLAEFPTQFILLDLCR
jgi:hypothetical protein